MIEYLNHNFSDYRKGQCVYVIDGRRWLYCIKCNMGCWYDPFRKDEFMFDLHLPRFNKNNKISHFGPTLNRNEHLTCEEFQIKNLLE